MAPESGGGQSRIARRSLLRAPAALAWLALARAAHSQGFAGLGGGGEGFAPVTPQAGLSFPADHGPHPAFRIEWWYLTANLKGPDGTEYGAQWTLFRSALAPRAGEGWENPQIWFAHAAVTTPVRHLTAERRARGGIGLAGVRAAPFRARIADWEMSAEGDGIERLRLGAAGSSFALDLALAAEGPIVTQGEGGYSLKSPGGQASYYYSQPFYRAQGRLTLAGGEVPVSGRAWLDREWSSAPLTPDQGGWDWVGLHLRGGAKLMGFRLRGRQTTTAGTWIEPGGQATPLPFDALEMVPQERREVAGRRLPARWRLRLPAQRLEVTLTPLNPRAWMDVTPPYWEGPARVAGTHPGIGYLEMTGY